MNEILRSSANGQNLSLTVKGILVALIPIITTLAGKLGVVIAQGELATIIEGIVGVIASIMIVYGAGRKIYIRKKNTPKPPDPSAIN